MDAAVRREMAIRRLQEEAKEAGMGRSRPELAVFETTRGDTLHSIVDSGCRQSHQPPRLETEKHITDLQNEIANFGLKQQHVQVLCSLGRSSLLFFCMWNLKACQFLQTYFTAGAFQGVIFFGEFFFSLLIGA